MLTISDLVITNKIRQENEKLMHITKYYSSMQNISGIHSSGGSFRGCHSSGGYPVIPARVLKKKFTLILIIRVTVKHLLD